MAWTEERVATLAKLWADGWSASQIANELGGVTRNAVIGKVHRLGLAQRDKPAGKGGSSGKRKQATRTEASGGTEAKTTARKPSPDTPPPKAEPKLAANANTAPPRGGDTETLERTTVESEVKVEDPAGDGTQEPKSRKLTLMQLTDTTCKWPNGDPTMPGFSFCGHTSEEEKPYCAFHSKLAFQPPSDRRRRR